MSTAIERLERFVAEGDRFSGINREEVFGLNGVSLSLVDLQEVIELAKAAGPDSYYLVDAKGHEWIFRPGWGWRVAEPEYGETLASVLVDDPAGNPTYPRLVDGDLIAENFGVRL